MADTVFTVIVAGSVGAIFVAAVEEFFGQGVVSGCEPSQSLDWRRKLYMG